MQLKSVWGWSEIDDISLNHQEIIHPFDFCSVKPITCFILKNKNENKIETSSNSTLFFSPQGKMGKWLQSGFVKRGDHVFHVLNYTHTPHY